MKKKRNEREMIVKTLKFLLKSSKSIILRNEMKIPDVKNIKSKKISARIWNSWQRQSFKRI